ncbi:AGE family epimerase/isomerase [uncultured Pelagimonas sp.]|uniref:AGE family epimerase/isomerase n=1 Tax=uncultured Pelagimonas sp. TaxID=1618102 RepID=UPI00260F6E82|nr:AGE family epimerase/isomerase [uncultured Pelagimonas sp.]
MTKDAKYWSEWFWRGFFANWVTQVQDNQGGVFDALDAEGKPDLKSGKSLLAQARALFTFSYVALLSGDKVLTEVARKQLFFINKFEKEPGLFRCNMTRDGTPTGNQEDEVARSYDQTFVILGLVTWNKLSPSKEATVRIDACWEAIETQLTDPATGLLLNDDSGIETGPAQNPHMHLYEACLQAFRMTNETVWLSRAAGLRNVGLRFFMNDHSGSVAEFLTHNLEPLPGRAGQRREVGHQCEWAWLMLEEADLSEDSRLLAPAEHLFRFAEKYGFSQDGPLKGAVFDAVSTEGKVVENTFLLWPQTEAIKILSMRHKAGDPLTGERAQNLLCLVFQRWFEQHPYFCNQLDADGLVVWDESLTRLMYHLILALLEGSKAGLWPEIPKKIVS